MLARCLLAAAALAAAPAAWSNGVDLNVNDDAARITVNVDLSNNLLLDGSWFHHEDNGDIAGAGLHLTGDASGGRSPVTAGLGGRLLWANSDVAGKDDGFVLPLGGFVEYTLPQYNRFSFGGSAYYAPDVLAFGDMTKYWEYNAWAGYSVLRQGQIYLGLRGIRAEYDDSPDVSFDTGVHVGLRLEF
jgi:hypothetical protein